MHEAEWHPPPPILVLLEQINKLFWIFLYDIAKHLMNKHKQQLLIVPIIETTFSSSFVRTVHMFMYGFSHMFLCVWMDLSKLVILLFFSLVLCFSCADVPSIMANGWTWSYHLEAENVVSLL